MPTFDYVIHNGTIYDGSLQAPFQADIGIRGNKIVDIGCWRDVHGQVIDAKGYVVAPGFIDVHHHLDDAFLEASHQDWTEEQYAELANNAASVRQGVTSIVTGNCGQGYADIAEWMMMAKAAGAVQNITPLIPHGALRLALFGREQPGILSAKQLGQMQDYVAESMERGAVGMSTGLSYAPGYQATQEELVVLAKVVARYGGIYTTHMRSESGLGILDAIDETVAIARAANIPVHISHLKLSRPFGDMTVDRVLERIEAARDSGVDITADQYPYEAGCTHLAYILPVELQAPSGVKKAVDKKTLYAAAEKALRDVLAPDKILFCDYVAPEYLGKSLEEVAMLEHRDPVDVYVDLVCTERAPSVSLFLTTKEMMKTIMRNHYVFTASDSTPVLYGHGKPHPRMYGSFIQKIKQFVLEEQCIDLAFALRSMTALPAETFQLHGRGMIAKGYDADLVVLDIDHLRAPATYEDPHRYAEGVRHVFIDGKPV